MARLNPPAPRAGPPDTPAAGAAGSARRPSTATADAGLEGRAGVVDGGADKGRKEEGTEDGLRKRKQRRVNALSE